MKWIIMIVEWLAGLLAGKKAAEKVIDAHERMADAVSRAPRTPADVDKRLRDGSA